MTIAPHALLIAPLAMAGEHTAIHAIAIGPIGGPPEFMSIPDPRVRDDQYVLVEWVGDRIEAYYATCRATGEHPQIWVSSGAAAGHLDILADRLRFTRDAPKIKRAGELLTYATERMPIAGQRALMTATEALALHYCTGQQEGEDEHLGAFLTWLDPPAGIAIARAVEAAERQVMDLKTDPEFDRNDLQSLVVDYNQARKNGASQAELRRRAKAIEDKLFPIVTTIYEAVQRALGYLRDFPPAGVLANLADHERDQFQSFMNSRDQKMPLPYRDSARPHRFSHDRAQRPRLAASIPRPCRSSCEHRMRSMRGRRRQPTRSRRSNSYCRTVPFHRGRGPQGRRCVKRYKFGLRCNMRKSLGL